MLNKDFIKSLLKEQREKLLKRDTGIERQAFQESADKLNLPHVAIITGIRRCGKSTLMAQIIKKNFSKTNFYYINFDDERWVGFEAKDFNLIYEALLELFGDAKTFFIDEIQNIKGFELFVRRFYDDGFKFIVTGSNSDLLSSELGSRLTGRYVNINLYPFSFIEFCKLKKIQFPGNKVFTTIEKATFYRQFEEYFFSGGMPEYIIYRNDESLKQTYHDLLIKDIAIRFNISNLSVLRELYIYLITNFGNRFNYTSLSKTAGIQSTSTIINYINYLELTYFAKQVRKFDFSLQKSQKNEKKLYISDNGFINLLSQSFTTDKGRLFENLVFNYLNKNVEIYYFSGKRECDFICTKNRNVFAAFQACYDLNVNNFERETSGLIEAMNYTGVEKAYILTLENNDEITIEGKKIMILPAWKWVFESFD
jgi:predicted AAA+ superfamily ATPase